MAEIVQFVRPSYDKQLEAALEAMLHDVRAGKLRSALVVAKDTLGYEHLLAFGAYRDRGERSNVGFKLQSMAADSSFG